MSAATPLELFKAGQLTQAVLELTQQVKAKPSDTSLRVFLFELLCFEGQWDRAAKQLDVIAGQGGTMIAEMAVQVYRDLLNAERLRHQVYRDDALPKFLLPPPPYADRYLVLVKKLQLAPAEAVAMLPEAEEQFPALAGRIGDRTFSSFRDADDRIAPILEVFNGADYLWVPFEQIVRLEVTEPTSLRNLVWARARIETYEQSVGDVFIPSLYVDSHANADEQVRLGRITSWQAIEEQLVFGAGQRVFLVDDQEVALLDLRDVAFSAQSAPVEKA